MAFFSEGTIANELRAGRSQTVGPYSGGLYNPASK